MCGNKKPGKEGILRRELCKCCLVAEEFGHQLLVILVSSFSSCLVEFSRPAESRSMHMAM